MDSCVIIGFGGVMNAELADGRASFGFEHSFPSDLKGTTLVNAAIVLAVTRGAPFNIAGSADFAQENLLSQIAYFHDQSDSLHALVDVRRRRTN